ncbi:hypothetical protein BDZ91DRAFT_731936 [Kalaharituber pfeilii]|nr:hypothetical protein BDZ91DRAFT_731936 [Kalaharituber pfeilii]
MRMNPLLFTENKEYICQDWSTAWYAGSLAVFPTCLLFCTCFLLLWFLFSSNNDLGNVLDRLA